MPAGARIQLPGGAGRDGRARGGRDGAAACCWSCSWPGCCAATPRSCAGSGPRRVGRRRRSPQPAARRARRQEGLRRRRWPDSRPTGTRSARLRRRRGAPTLLAFLTTGCGTCAGFWATPGRAAAARRRADRDRHPRSRSRAPGRAARAGPDGVPVVMSSQAWSDYAVPGAPYFVLVDAAIRGEGAATGWTALASLVCDAIGEPRAGAAPVGEEARGGEARTRRSRTHWPMPGSGPATRACIPAGSKLGDVRDAGGTKRRQTGELVIGAWRRSRRSRLGLVTLRRIDAGEHHSARRAGPPITWAITVIAFALGSTVAQRRSVRRSVRWERSCPAVSASRRPRSAPPGWRWRWRSISAGAPPRAPAAGRRALAGSYRGWVYGVGFGGQLGSGVLTVVSSAATYVALWRGRC